MQIVRSDEQPKNAESPRVEIRQGDSNLKSDRLRQYPKQEPESIAVDEGMQIDRSDEHASNADSAKVEILHPDPNVTDKRELHRLKHPAEMTSVSVEMVTSSASPKYRTRQISSKSTKKSPETLKNRLSS
jgi:hypothetical protein